MHVSMDGDFQFPVVWWIDRKKPILFVMVVVKKVYLIGNQQPSPTAIMHNTRVAFFTVALIDMTVQ